MRRRARAVSVDDAFSQIQDGNFEFAILDINMRGGMTFPLADEFRRKNVPFAFLSGYDRRVIPPRFDTVPNWGKPYDGHEIVSGIQVLSAPSPNKAVG